MENSMLQRQEAEKKSMPSVGNSAVQLAKVMGNQAVAQRMPVIQMAILSGFGETDNSTIENAITTAIGQLNQASSSLTRYKSKHRRSNTEKAKKYIDDTKAILEKADLAINKTDEPNTYGYALEGKMYLNIDNGINIKTIIHEAFHLAGYNLVGMETTCECEGEEALTRLLNGDNPNADTFAQFVLRCNSI